MSKFDAFMKDLESASVLELNELVKAIEEKFGVSAAAVAVAAHRQAVRGVEGGDLHLLGGLAAEHDARLAEARAAADRAVGEHLDALDVADALGRLAEVRQVVEDHLGRRVDSLLGGNLHHSLPLRSA